MADAFLDVDQIRAQSFVRHVELHESLDSTNSRAIELAGDPAIELPALVVARHQTAGRGRGQNTWWSAEGALTFSVLLDPATMGIDTESWPQLSLTTAVAVCDALQEELEALGGPRSATSNCQWRLGIKWPNDVVLHERKICGILIESPSGSAPAKHRVIIGIGINVNNTTTVSQSDSGLNAIALCEASGMQHQMWLVLHRVLMSLELRLSQLAAHDDQLPTSWQRLSIVNGRTVSVRTGAQETIGTCHGIGRNGAILIENETGQHAAVSGTLRIVASAAQSH